MILVFLIIILIITIFLLIYKCTEKFDDIDYELEKQNIEKLEDLKLYNNYHIYRLGDGFYLTENKNQWIQDKNNKLYKDVVSLHDYHDMYPDSILSEYLKLSNYKAKKWNILQDIVKYKFNQNNINNIDRKTECLIHLRVGDAIDIYCNENYFFDKFYKNKTYHEINNKTQLTCKYIKPLSFFKQKAIKLKKKNFRKIYIIAGSHIELETYKYSTYYINKIKELFENNDINVELKLGGSPDDDLLFSMNFDYFIQSKGQYCRLIRELNELINPNFKIL